MKKIITILVLALFIFSLIPAVIAEKGKGKYGDRVKFDDDKDDSKRGKSGKMDDISKGMRKAAKNEFKEMKKMLKGEYKEKLQGLKAIKEDLKAKKSEIKDIRDKIKKKEATDAEKVDYVKYAVSITDASLEQIKLLIDKFQGNELLLKKLEITQKNLVDSKKKLEDTIADNLVSDAELETLRREIKSIKGSLGLIKSDVKEKIEESKLNKLHGIRARVKAVISALERAAEDVESRGGNTVEIRAKITEIKSLMSSIEQAMDAKNYSKVNELLGQLKTALHAVVGKFTSQFAREGLKKRLKETRGNTTGNVTIDVAPLGEPSSTTTPTPSATPA